MRSLIGLAIPTALVLAGAAVADRPVRNVNRHLHPNIAAAQRLTQQAYDRMGAAQAANEFDMGGHAARARDLLNQASNEMKLAALAANRN